MGEFERRLELLVQNPRESMEVEIKDWLDLDEKEHQADLVKAILALANHGGGYILIGFREVSGVYQQTDTEQRISELYNQDRINGVVARYADPQIHIECYLLHSNSKKHPVIVVPGGHSVPIRCIRGGPEGKHVKQNTYYIRRPGPASEEPQSGQEWSELIRKCVLADKERLVEQIRSLLTGEVSKTPLEGAPIKDLHLNWLESVDKRFLQLNDKGFGGIDKSPFQRGYWQGGYTVVPTIEGLNLGTLKQGLQKCVGSETGWPIGLFLTRDNTRPYPHEGCVEVWLAESQPEPDSSDFWRACPSGNFVVIRDFQEDCNGWTKGSPGSGFDFITPIWRVGELLLHASRFVKEFSPEGGSLIITVKWTGLRGRQLTTSSPKYFGIMDRKAAQNEVSSIIIIQDSFSVVTNLVELTEQLTRPLYEAFDFFQIPKQTIVNELNEMRNRR